MLPSLAEAILFMAMGIFIYILGRATKKFFSMKVYIAEALAALVAVLYTFYQYPFVEGMLYISIISGGYLAMYVTLAEQERQNKIGKELKELDVQEIQLMRDGKRWLLDVSISLLVGLGGILFIVYGPDQSPLKFLLLFVVLLLFLQMGKRYLIFRTTKLYLDERHNKLYIYSWMSYRNIPLEEIKNITYESTVDILKLHPLLTLFSTNTDFTTSMKQVVRISLSTESLYINIKEGQLPATLAVHNSQEINLVNSDQVESETNQMQETVIQVLPFYHPKNIKRALGKLYFAITVQGISAYTGLLLLLYIMGAPTWSIAFIIFIYWLFNLYISDQILKIAMDAKEITNEKVKEAAQQVFDAASMPTIKIYETESAQYNGFATGMNIGRAMITLTTQTMKLPIEAIQGIIAHEAIHVKKRDVLWNQIWKVLFLGFLFCVMYGLYYFVPNLEEHIVSLFIIIWFLMLLFPVFLSFVAQWMEVRADHLGSTLLPGRKQQMAHSLRSLAIFQDEVAKKERQYKGISEEEQPKSSLDRENWFLRIVHFQMMSHPPMYWRIDSLENYPAGWGKEIRKRWMKDRWRESISRK